MLVEHLMRFPLKVKKQPITPFELIGCFHLLNMCST